VIVKRRFFELREQIFYFSRLRGNYVRIIRRSLLRKTNRFENSNSLRKIGFWVLGIILIIIGILIGYRYPSIGFSNYITPSGDFQRGKTLWDWIQLLVIPIILAVLAYYLSSSQKDREIAITQIEKRETALQNYFDYMTRVLIEQDYSDEELFEGASRLIRARTLSTLDMVDGKQKGYLLRFLIEAELLDKDQPYLNMRRANLSGLVLEPGLYSNFKLDVVNLDNAVLAWCHFQDVQMNSISMMNADLEKTELISAGLDYILLNHSDLYQANLSKARMIKANLQDAILENAQLNETIINRANFRGANMSRIEAKGADFSSSDLSFTNLKKANLEDANLTHVNFYGANLKNANLSNVDLTGSNITNRQICQAKSIHGAKLPQSIKTNHL
jgi:uncharacterized protein YjbI with pentapeptide repeats